MSPSSHMTFWDHLEELRNRLLKLILAAVIGTVAAFFVSDYILDFLLLPAKRMEHPLDLQVLQVQGMFIIKLQTAFIAGLILALPVLIYQIWAFVSPALYENEKKYLIPVMIFGLGLFITGVSFAYFVVIPFAMMFLTALGPEYIRFNVSITSYIGFIIRLCLLMGIVFEMPLLALLLGRMGLLSAAWLRKFRRHSVVIIFILSAVFTPPDVLTQVFMAGPLIILYELSIYIVKIVEKKREHREESDHESD